MNYIFYNVYKDIGDVIKPISDHSMRLGIIISISDSKEESLNHVRKAVLETQILTN